MIRKRLDCRKLYERVYGKIPDDYDIHHIIPIHAGGQDIIENLEAISRKEHAQRHYDLYLKNGNKKDLASYYILSFDFNKSRKIYASIGGRLGGKIQVQKGLGIHKQTREERLEILKEARLKQKELGILFYDSNFQSEQGKKGGIKNKGFRWYNNTIKTFKYTSREQEILSFDEFLIINPQYKKGRK